ncbi:MAG: phosphate propanoyltransferase [Bacillota bacterium]|nr:phosphate propanoyltransferase [Bacillota bacterium]MDD3297538.1 phosphate propanoyltransferase [Bacillota bacterium]MDD3850214.1 phosphate propanoyltransferase [Bacillota bacterium]MDD4707243.1 phosphate propanoyltransferase [Bacillota bacterium]
MSGKKVSVGLSNKHLHVTQEHLEKLFGAGHELTEFKILSQPGQYACDEKVDIVGPKGTLKGVRILGPVRKETQIEISVSDAFKLGLKVPVRDSGDIEGTPGVKIVGPKGEVDLEYGVIVAARHIHMHPDDAKVFGVEDFQRVKVRAEGMRALVFENVLIRVSPTFALDMHIDIEEGNAAGISNGDMVEVIID